jgi:hypothetical protein
MVRSSLLGVTEEADGTAHIGPRLYLGDRRRIRYRDPRGKVKPHAHPLEPAWAERVLDRALEPGGAPFFLLLVALLLVASVGLTLWLSRWSDRRSRRRRVARAQRAERDAAGLLEAHGFAVLGRQVRQSWSLVADADEVEFTLIADYLVERRGRRWVAEVKTGERALDLRHAPTRRQLLEYRQAFAVDGVLIVDAEGQSLRSVHFRDASAALPVGASRSGRAAAFGAGLISGLSLAGYWFFTHGWGTISP